MKYVLALAMLLTTALLMAADGVPTTVTYVSTTRSQPPW
jgi:hypothetical protein